jgi:hypothetical protein
MGQVKDPAMKWLCHGPGRDIFFLFLVRGKLGAYVVLSIVSLDESYMQVGKENAGCHLVKLEIRFTSAVVLIYS